MIDKDREIAILKYRIIMQNKQISYLVERFTAGTLTQ